MIYLTLDNDGLILELARMMIHAQDRADEPTRVRQAWHNGRVSGLETALETADAAVRSAQSGCAVPLRTAEGILIDLVQQGWADERHVNGLIAAALEAGS